MQWLQAHARDVSAVLPSDAHAYWLHFTVQGRDPGTLHGLGCSWLQVQCYISFQTCRAIADHFAYQVEFNFGVVDISSGMKRIEASKDAYRNLVIIGEDGFTEYSQVKLEPSNW